MATVQKYGTEPIIMMSFITPHLRIFPKDGYEKWPEKIRKMAKLYSQAEYNTVISGIRKSAVVHVDPSNVDTQLNRFSRDGLIFTPILKAGYQANGFTHFHKPVNPGEPYYWYGCVTKKHKDGQIFKEAELSKDHSTIGRLLGFPDCCINYFINWFPKNYDPVWIREGGRVKGYPECNQLLKYFNVRMVSHISCSPRCKMTKIIGNMWYKVMEKIDKTTSIELFQLLSVPTTWNSYHGVVQIETPYFLGLSHTFPYMEKPRIIKWAS